MAYRTPKQIWQYNRYIKLKGGLSFIKGNLESILSTKAKLPFMHRFERGIINDIIRDINLSLDRFDKLTKELKEEID